MHACGMSGAKLTSEKITSRFAALYSKFNCQHLLIPLWYLKVKNLRQFGKMTRNNTTLHIVLCT